MLDAGFVAFGPADRDEYLQFGSERKRFDGRLSRPKSYFVALIKAEELFDAMPVRAGRFPYILHQGTDAYYKCLLRAATIEEFCRIMDIVEADLDYADQQKKLAELDLLNSGLDPTPVEVSDIEHKKFLVKMSREILAVVDPMSAWMLDPSQNCAGSCRRKRTSSAAGGDPGQRTPNSTRMSLSRKKTYPYPPMKS